MSVVVTRPPAVVVAAGFGLAACGALATNVAAAAETFALTGDARVRYEEIDVDPGDDVSRERYRLRVGGRFGLADAVSLHVRLATGTGDPVSTNLNFGESFSADDIQLDRAYLTWRVNGALELSAGKMKNPLYRPGGSSLNWDSDLNPEGVAAELQVASWFGTAAIYDVADRADDGSALLAVQAGRRWNVGPDGSLTAGVGYFDYLDAQGHVPFYRGIAAGNTVDTEGNYVFDYDILEVFCEYAVTVKGQPVELFLDGSRNLAADRQNRAFAAGINVGQVDERGGLAATWAWHETDADAVVGAFTESDLAGGNTDSRGQLIRLQYALTENLVAGATLIFSEFGHFAGNVREFDRLMLDMEFRF